MSDPSPTLVGEQQTMLMTLRMHAQDASSERPILGDAFATSVLDRIGRSGAERAIDGNRPVVCTRARLIDDEVRGFLGRHSDAVVLHLGCGLDSRVLRVDPPAGVTWLEVDQAPAMALRRTAYDARPGVHDVAASVTDPGWWSVVPTGRPLLAVAEGLLPYLSADAVRTLVDHLVDLDPQAILLADTVAPWVRRIAGWHPAFRAAGTGFASTTPDLTAALRNRGLSSRVASLPRATARFSTGATATFLRAFCTIPALEQSMVLHQVGTGTS